VVTRWVLFGLYSVKIIPADRFFVGESISITVSSDELGGANHLSAEATGKILYLSGWIIYEDATGNDRSTFFCRQYDQTRESFAPVDDPECNCTY
jgi:hypothetical protein